jgi:hypothetical protein
MKKTREEIEQIAEVVADAMLKVHLPCARTALPSYGGRL